MDPNQKLLDRVVPRLRRQRKKSVNADNLCLYRGPDGLKCLIGHGIDDRYYSGEHGDTYKHKIREAVFASNPDIKGLRDNFDGHFWASAQTAHDRSGPNLELFEDYLASACKRFGYTVPPLEKT